MLGIAALVGGGFRGWLALNKDRPGSVLGLDAPAALERVGSERSHRVGDRHVGQARVVREAICVRVARKPGVCVRVSVVFLDWRRV